MGVIVDCQHGVHSKRSCNTHILEVIDDLTIAIENNQPVEMMLLHFKKALDFVNHQRLITMLNVHFISDTILSCIGNFLSE